MPILAENPAGLMQPTFILALDQGTTSSRSLLIDAQGQVHASAQAEFEQLYPQPGWVEHRPDDLWNTQWRTAQEALEKAGIGTDLIAGIGIANQRETSLVWDKQTGKPIYNAIVWQDRRTADFCDQLKADAGTSKTIQSRTGLVIDAYFSASKIRWILNEVEGARERAERGELAFGTVETWLVWKLSNGTRHVTDASNASRTMLFNIHSLAWDEELCRLFDIPLSLLPEIVDNSGSIAQAEVFEHPIPISGMAGDQQAALFGQQCFAPGMVKNTYGTGCFMLMNTGRKAVQSKNSLLTTVGWRRDGETTYALEGSVFIGGAGVQWLRDELQIIDESFEVEALAREVESTDGVFVVPAFAGLGAPHWNPHARGCIFGMTRGTGRPQIARAVLESIAFQSMDVLEAMRDDSGVDLKTIRVDGGAAENDLLMQFQADVMNLSVVRPTNSESTALGAAFLAGLGVGFWKDEAHLAECWGEQKRFSPATHRTEIDRGIQEWRRAVRATSVWADDRNNA